MRPLGFLGFLLLVSVGLVAGSAAAGPQEFQNKEFAIMTLTSNGSVLDATSSGDGAPVVQYHYKNTNNQHWKVIPVGDGFYKIVGLMFGRYLAVKGGPSATADGVTLQMAPAAAGDNQKFLLDLLDPKRGVYRIIAKHSHKVLDIDGNMPCDFQPLQQFSWNGGANQMFSFIPANKMPLGSPMPHPAKSSLWVKMRDAILGRAVGGAVVFKYHHPQAGGPGQVLISPRTNAILSSHLAYVFPRR